MDKKYFFGWENIKHFLREWNKMYSASEKSFYSHKRVQTGVAFLTFIVGWISVLIHLLLNPETTILEFVEWAVPLLAIAGFVLNKTEAAKTIQSKETIAAKLQEND